MNKDNEVDQDSAVLEVLNEKDGYYSEAYSELFVHEGMLKDKVRTMTYKRAIETNKHLFKDKVVLDIGCGTGILSMFAASAGARTVIGVDCSEIAKSAEKIVRANNFDNIYIVQSKVEQIEELPDCIEKVDIIVSEWMGVCLFHESMLSTVVYARDRWLKPGGLIFPDCVRLYICAIEHSRMAESRIYAWSNMYGFNMSALKKTAYKEATTETVDATEVLSDPMLLKEVDLTQCTADFSFKTSFRLNINRDDFVYAFLTYFDAVFKHSHYSFVLSTSPNRPQTHWRQTVFYIDRVLHMQEGESIDGVFSLKKHKNNFRDLAIELDITAHGAYCKYSFTNDFILR